MRASDGPVHPHLLRTGEIYRQRNEMKVDESQIFCEVMNTSKADPFALALSYRLGIMMANQYAG